MKFKRYSLVTALLLTVVGIGCRDKDLYPLPYDDREVGAYMRLYSLTSNVIDLNDLANSGLDGIFEAVDGAGGNNLQEVQVFVSHRRGAGLTAEVALKIIPGSDFEKVAEPTFSEYKRAKVRVTAAEAQTALLTVTTDPDGSGPLVGYPGVLAVADQVIYRTAMVLKDGRTFTSTNTTPNITGGQFYSASFVYTLTVRAAIPPINWVGAYTLTQNSIWSINHSAALHAGAQFPSYIAQVLFPAQTVNLTIPSGGLVTERQFTVNYRGQNVTLRINLENGTVFVPLQNSTVDCSANRELYWTMPTSGNFTVAAGLVMPPLTPQATTANQGTYTTTGLIAGNALTIGLDDDADEYGRRNGYCTWTRRVRLTLTRP
jgi:hypothetical protein